MSVKKPFVQFSKRMVVLVMVSVTVIIAIAVAGMIYDSAYDQLPMVLEHYLGFAGIVFVAYSGNSALEKWVLNRSKPSSTSEADASSEGSTSVG